MNEQKSVAWWDDSVIKITDEAIDLEFIDANFGIFLTETYGHDEVYILNADDRPLYTHSRTPSGEIRPAFERRRPRRAHSSPRCGAASIEACERVPTSFSELAKQLPRAWSGVLRSARWAGHIVSVDGRPAVVAALTIVPNVEHESAEGDAEPPAQRHLYRRSFHVRDRPLLLLPDLALTPSQRTATALFPKPLSAMTASRPDF